MRRLLPILIAVIFLFLSGCAKKPPRVVTGEVGRVSKASEKLQLKVEEFSRKTHSIKALVKLSVSDESESRDTEAALIVIRPNRIRIDAMDSLADVWAKIGSDGEHLWLYLPAKNKLYKGRSVRKNLQRLLKFDMDVADLVSVITGLPPVKDGLKITQLGKKGEGLFIADGGLLRIRADGRKMLVRECVQYGDDGEKIDYIAKYDDYRSQAGIDFPYHVEVVFPQRNAKAVVEYVDVAFSGDIDPAIFTPVKGRRRKTTNLDYLSESR